MNIYKVLEDVTVSTLEKIARALKVDVSELMKCYQMRSLNKLRARRFDSSHRLFAALDTLNAHVTYFWQWRFTEQSPTVPRNKAALWVAQCEG